MDDRSHRLGWQERIIACAPHIHHDLAIRIAISYQFGQLEGKSCLADAPNAPYANDFRSTGKLRPQLFQFGITAREIRGWIWDCGNAGDLFSFRINIIIYSISELLGKYRAIDIALNIGLMSLNHLAALIDEPAPRPWLRLDLRLLVKGQAFWLFLSTCVVGESEII